MKKYELELTEDNIRKTIENNILGRNNNLVMLGKMLLNQNENIMISLDGIWGSGKTFFIKQFEYLIKNIDEFPDNKLFVENDKEIFRKLKDNNLVIYYNAWQNDDHEEPLESIMYATLNEFPNQKNQLISFKEYKKIVKGFIWDVIRVASLETIDMKHFDEMKSYEDITSSIITIEEKKDSFNKLINEILTDNQRLILIVDELDRCKPTFAVKMLETLKHFYDNDKITIIVVTNNSELSHTIKKFYGYEFDGCGYLNKFYDAVISLEIKDIKQYLQNQLNFCNRTYLPYDMSYLILRYYNFLLRECNKFITIYNLLSSYIETESDFNRNENYVFSCILLPLAIALKIKHIDLYHQFMNNKGENIIREFIKGSETQKEMIDWIKELLGNPEQDYIDIIIDYYKQIFDKTNSIYRINFHDAISLLGTKLQIEDNKNS